MQPRSLLSQMPARWVSEGIYGSRCWDGLTAMAVKRVLGLRDREVGLSDAVLAVEKLADDAVGLRDGSTEGGERELAVADQREFDESSTLR